MDLLSFKMRVVLVALQFQEDILRLTVLSLEPLAPAVGDQVLVGKKLPNGKKIWKGMRRRAMDVPLRETGLGTQCISMPLLQFFLSA